MAKKKSSPEQVHNALKCVVQELTHALPPLPHSTGEAAVLVPIILHPDKPTILLTQRTEHLPHHPGQIAFSGGRVDPTDKDIKAYGNYSLPNLVSKGERSFLTQVERISLGIDSIGTLI